MIAFAFTFPPATLTSA